MIYTPVTTALLTLVICFYARPIANRLQVFDYPRGGRKAHADPTPQVGGLAILAPLILWCCVAWWFGSDTRFYLAVLLCGAGVGIVGVMDDQSHLSASGRLLLLGVFTLIAFAVDPALISPTIPWITFGSTPISAGLFIGGAVLALAGFVSSVNMADGIDGLVPAAMLTWCLEFDLFATGSVRMVSMALTGPLLVVLIFNLRRKTFLGDCGTFGVGFVLALLAIACLRTGSIASETLLVWFFLPVLDCVRVIIARLIRGRSPLRGGKDHFHHILADIFGRRRAFYVYAVAISSTSLTAAVFPRVSLYILVAIAASCLGFVAARRVLFERRMAALARSASASSLQPEAHSHVASASG